MAQPGKLFLGPVIHCLSASELDIIPFALVGVNSEGTIVSLIKNADPENTLDLLAALDVSPDLNTLHVLAPGQVRQIRALYAPFQLCRELSGATLLPNYSRHFPDRKLLADIVG